MSEYEFWEMGESLRFAHFFCSNDILDQLLYHYLNYLILKFYLGGSKKFNV